MTTYYAHPKRNRWVEQTTRNAKEHPRIDRKREPEAQRNVLQLLRIAPHLSLALAGRGLDVVRHLRAAEGEVEEEHRADVLAAHGDEVVADVVRDALGEGDTQHLFIGLYFVSLRGVGGLGEGECDRGALKGGLGCVCQCQRGK